MTSRPDTMTELEWLVALEEIRQLKARRDRYVDAHDWEAYAALHAPDHISHNDGAPEWHGPAELIENVSRIMDGMVSAHHSYDAEIDFDTPTTARATWAMIAGSVAKDDDAESWTLTFGYYYETYERRDGTWLFTSRRWHRYFSTGSEGVTLPTEMPRGAADPSRSA